MPAMVPRPGSAASWPVNAAQLPRLARAGARHHAGMVAPLNNALLNYLSVRGGESLSTAAQGTSSSAGTGGKATVSKAALERAAGSLKAATAAQDAGRKYINSRRPPP